jgi:hypothetical protein
MASGSASTWIAAARAPAEEGAGMSKSRFRKRVAAVTAVPALMAAGPAYAVGGPNSPGNSGHFNPNSAPCQGPNDQPNCPGPTH